MPSLPEHKSGTDMVVQVSRLAKWHCRFNNRKFMAKVRDREDMHEHLLAHIRAAVGTSCDL